MTEHRIGTQEEWQAKRSEMLKEEKELASQSRAGTVPPAQRAVRGQTGHPRSVAVVHAYPGTGPGDRR
jgi:hypothetical protein